VALGAQRAFLAFEFLHTLDQVEDVADQLVTITVLLAQAGKLRLLHAVEGRDVGFLPGRRLLAGETHGQEGEAVAGHAVVGNGSSVR